MSGKSSAAKKNLLLCFDAFGTLFTPNTPIPVVYARVAAKHGIDCGERDAPGAVGAQFKTALKEESKKHPNYGKATNLGAEKWWADVIRKTFSPFLKSNQEVPSAMVQELLHRYSTSEGYDIYPDVLPFFKQLRNTRSETSQWPFKNTVVGIITNSDDRVPGILDSFGLKIGPRRLGQADQRSEKATLEDDISFVVLSYDVGVEKPERKMFDAATDMLLRTLEGYEQNLKADSFERLYVGDELEKDYNGAQAAGWNAILLNRQHDPLSASASDLRWTSMKSKDGNEHKVLVAGSVADISKWRPSTTG